jgi:hypothetical protein
MTLEQVARSFWLPQNLEAETEIETAKERVSCCSESELVATQT